MLKIEQLSTQIGAYRAVDSVSLEIKQGEFVSLIGANGARSSISSGWAR